MWPALTSGEDDIRTGSSLWLRGSNLRLGHAGFEVIFSSLVKLLVAFRSPLDLFTRTLTACRLCSFSRLGETDRGFRHEKDSGGDSGGTIEGDLIRDVCRDLTSLTYDMLRLELFFDFSFCTFLAVEGGGEIERSGMSIGILFHGEDGADDTMLEMRE